MNLRIEVFSYVQNYCLADLLFSCRWISLPRSAAVLMSSLSCVSARKAG
jgi:hypothetical protein